MSIKYIETLEELDTTRFLFQILIRDTSLSRRAGRSRHTPPIYDRVQSRARINADGVAARSVRGWADAGVRIRRLGGGSRTHSAIRDLGQVRAAKKSCRGGWFRHIAGRARIGGAGW
jgi:hypothetical protein